jgi:predicted nucleic acid-binding protein
MKTNKSVIIDASCVDVIILNEEPKARVIAATTGISLFAPSILPMEVLNSLSRYYKRGWISSEIVSEAWNSFKTLPIRPVQENMDNIEKLCNAYKIYAYDATYLEVASRLGLTLLTLDKPMAVVAHDMKISLLEV